MKDSEAGILIKQICDFMFGSELVTDEESQAVKSYFSAIKVQLSKSKTQSVRAQKQTMVKSSIPITLEKIRTDFPFISGYLREDNKILEGVDMSSLYAFIKENQTALQTLNMYQVVVKYREQAHTDAIPNT